MADAGEVEEGVAAAGERRGGRRSVALLDAIVRKSAVVRVDAVVRVASSVAGGYGRATVSGDLRVLSPVGI